MRIANDSPYGLSGGVWSSDQEHANDGNEIVSFVFFGGSLDELRQSQRDFDYAGWRAKIDALVESTQTDGIFEVVIEQGR